MALLAINSSCRTCDVEFHRPPSKMEKAPYCSITCYQNRGTTIVPTCHPEREHAAAGLCSACYQANYVALNRERVIAGKRSWRSKNPRRHFNEYLEYEYGLTVEGWDKLIAEQEGLCAICRNPPIAPKHRLTVDHDHTTDEVRGLLCGFCNKGLGSFRDNLEVMRNAVKYLEKYDSVSNS